MTSEAETLKTNEFLRRRKLRLQQVREQSKDIAKKIRQRAQVETLRHVVDLDANKQKEYFDRQEKLVKRLEVLYARGLNNIGASHQSASELRQDEVIKTDLSKVRGREAAAELRKKRQEKLDQQKKLLDRKVQARETANVISREKSSAVVNKLTKVASKNSEEASQKGPATDILNACIPDVNHNEPEAVTKNDMATQWDAEKTPNEWQPAVPTLVLPNDDQGSLNQDEKGTKSDHSKRLDLFAVSKEMPTDLGGQHVHVSDRRDTVRPSLTLVSEYLQTRKLRLRETEPRSTNKKSDDMSSLKQTIIRTRNTKTEGRSYDVCHVLDEQVIPVPSWHAETSCEFCSNQGFHNKSLTQTKPFTSVTNSQINRIFSSIRPVKQCGVGPTPVLRSSSPFRRSKVCQRFIPGKGAACADNSKADHVLNKKSSVTMYNHNTRDTRDLPCSDEQLVVRDSQTEEDAYAQALKEALLIRGKDKEHPKKVQDMRNKVAVTKQTVEKEYKDTINFLNSLPKDKGSKVTKTAYMDDRGQQMQNENRQHKLQQEYRKIETECRRHHSCSKKGHSKSRPISKQDVEDDFDIRDFQYSWMPVPEGDGNLAIHAIPNTVKEGKSGNTVKFSQVDSYHEYRSRHKHTPPTKDTTSQDKNLQKNRPHVIIDKNASQSTDDSSTASDTSSVENLRLEKKKKRVRQNTKEDQNTSDAERIIIYKILDRKSGKQSKKKNKLLSDIAKSLTSIEKVQKSVIEDNNGEPVKRQHAKGKPVIDTTDNSVSFEHVNEGIYKIAEEKKDNMSSMYSLNETDSPENPPIAGDKHQSRTLSSDKKRGSVPEWETGHISQPQRAPKSYHCSTTSRENHNNSAPKVQNIASTSKHLATSSSSSSFATAKNDKSKTEPSEGGYIKLVDDAGLETGKFFLGDAGYLKDNAYEVVIQLRKKDSSKDEEKSQGTALPELNKESTTESIQSKPCEEANTEIVEPINLVTSESDINIRHNLEADKDSASKHTSKKWSRGTSPRISKEPDIIELEIEIKTADQYNAPCEIEETHHKKTTEQKNNVSDKGTSTAIQNDYQTPIARFDPPSRPATTTYTQTTSSPIHRPVYIHMSSSTSTAYMSPPDMILPNFMRRDSGLTDYETSEFRNEDTTRKSEGSGRHFKKCRHARKSVSKVNMQPTDCRKNNLNSTPPNSVRSSRNSADNLRLHKVSRSKNLKPDKKCKCYNCAVSTKDEVYKCRTKTRNGALDSYRSSQNFNPLTGMKSTTKTNRTTSSACSRKNRDATLAPIVKGYINKLLSLNKEGLKALEVADQECSSVGTPGSSIINVSRNIDGRKSSIGNKISLEHIKKDFLRQIMHEHLNNHIMKEPIPSMFITASKKCLPRKPRRKSVHKIKSLNISKNLLKKHKTEEPKSSNHVSVSTTTDEYSKTFASSNASRSRPRSSPSSRQGQIARPSCTFKQQFNSEDITPRKHVKKVAAQSNKKPEEKEINPNLRKQYIPKRATVTDTSPETESTKESHNYYKSKPDIPISMSTQTSQNIDSEFMKLAEDKLHNMEKIADLTEKCTKRLSNLAKVLEEVRKNKSLVYSQISTSDSTDSHSDQKSDKLVKTPVPIDLGDVPNTFEIKSPEPNPEKEYTTIARREKTPSEFISFLIDIPKPVYKLSEQTDPAPSNGTNLVSPIPLSPINTETTEIIKCKQKPPPAMSRIHLKHGQEDIVPHELSTVMEVDSPMSIKNKTHSSRRYDPNTSNRSSNEDKETTKNNKNSETSKGKESIANPDLLQSNLKLHKHPKITTSNDSKFQMIDLKHFNEIMLEPFISIHEYARKYNVEAIDEMSNIEELYRDDAMNDDMSSLHSDGSLPDVIAELLKRNIITEPFKFDTPSNVNSTTISSESTLSMLALSQVRKGKKRGNVMFRNKENVGETSDTLSISSNPDLENAFKKLGMGWASSTLKKTKERLALSSSSNTSSSSISQLKIKTFHHDIPALVTDSVSSVLLSKKGLEPNILVDNSKDAKHQTSFPDSMTVNEFLANELANKITFTTNKTGINETEEFVSLFETKMPEGMNQQTRENCDENSNDSVPSGVNRARTSTPVQIFKSMTYHSSSGSNISNGLFSNADDLSSVKMTSNSMKNNSTPDKDELTIPNFSLKMKKGIDSSKSD